jgi:hypothetical protein
MKKYEALAKLNERLIQNLYPFSKIRDGKLEAIYGVHLEEIDRGTHEHIKVKPQSINDRNWIKKTALSWGANTGWDITTDGTIALCRVDYDDYISFKIQYLSEDETEKYKDDLMYR